MSEHYQPPKKKMKKRVLRETSAHIEQHMQTNSKSSWPQRKKTELQREAMESKLPAAGGAVEQNTE
jgi:hypothetical protein